MTVMIESVGERHVLPIFFLESLSTMFEIRSFKIRLIIEEKTNNDKNIIEVKCEDRNIIQNSY